MRPQRLWAGTLVVLACGDNRVPADLLDTQAPVVTIVAPFIPPRTSDARPAVSFTVTDAGAVTTACAIDDGAFAACATGFGASADLDEAAHTYHVRATDEAGTSTTVEVTFIVDVTPPDAMLTSAPANPTFDPTPTFEFTVGADAAAVRCALDSGQVVDPCASPITFDAANGGPVAAGDRTFTLTVADDAVAPNTRDVTYAFQIATDGCGNGVIEGTEECDGAALGGATCSSLGFHSGHLGCSASCTRDTSACFAPANSGFTGKVCFDGLRFPVPGNGGGVTACTEEHGILRSTLASSPTWSSVNGMGTATQVVTNLRGRGVFPQPDGPSVVFLADSAGTHNAFRSSNVVTPMVPTTWTQSLFTSGGMPVELFSARPGSSTNNILGGWHPALGATVLHGSLSPSTIVASPVGTAVTGTVRSIATGANGATTDILVAVHGQTPSGAPATGGIYWTCDQIGPMGGTYAPRDSGIPASDKPLVWSLTVDPASFTTETRTCPSTGATVGGYARVYYAALRGGGQIYKTSDGGQSWTPRNAGLPGGAEVYKIAIDCFSTAHPIQCPGCRCVNRELLYAATSMGLYRSADGGGTWTPAGFEGSVVRAVTLEGQHPVDSAPRVFVGVDDAIGIYQANAP